MSGEDSQKLVEFGFGSNLKKIAGLFLSLDRKKIPNLKIYIKNIVKLNFNNLFEIRWALHQKHLGSDIYLVSRPKVG